MAKTHFDFKQFTIWHDKCAMKVGTDGVLLGAWAPAGNEVRSILDIGTGSGLIAIMMAQKCEADILGIDIDAEAVAQAKENGAKSPWAERLRFEQQDALSFAPEKEFDLIVSNPPFYTEDLQCPEARRNNARHSQALPLERLAANAARWLREGGVFCIVLPAAGADAFIQAAWEHGLDLHRRCQVYSRPETPAKRSLLGFRKGGATYPATERIIIRDDAGNYTEEYKSLTGEYYLHF